MKSKMLAAAVSIFALTGCAASGDIYTGVIKCEQLGMFVQYETVRAESPEEAREKVQYRLDHWTKYWRLKIEECGLAELRGPR